MTKTEADIKALEESLAELKKKQLEEEAAKAVATRRMRRLSVALHSLLCTLPHDPDPQHCHWRMSRDNDDADLADWTERDHALWLKRTQMGVAGMVSLGFVVEDPAE